jgi:hypothetical protein
MREEFAEEEFTNVVATDHPLRAAFMDMMENALEMSCRHETGDPSCFHNFMRRLDYDLINAALQGVDDLRDNDGDVTTDNARIYSALLTSVGLGYIFRSKGHSDTSASIIRAARSPNKAAIAALLGERSFRDKGTQGDVVVDFLSYQHHPYHDYATVTMQGEGNLLIITWDNMIEVFGIEAEEDQKAPNIDHKAHLN